MYKYACMHVFICVHKCMVHILHMSVGMYVCVCMHTCVRISVHVQDVYTSTYVWCTCCTYVHTYAPVSVSLLDEVSRSVSLPKSIVWVPKNMKEVAVLPLWTTIPEKLTFAWKSSEKTTIDTKLRTYTQENTSM